MKILVAGIGNIFLGDDAFGVEVVQRLSTISLPSEVTVGDFGIRSYDLAYAMMDDYDVTVLLDTTSRGQPPGTVSLIEPDVSAMGEVESIDAHSMNPMHVLRMVQSLGGHPGRLYLIGCEPEILESEEGQLGLSAPVQAAIPHAIEILQALFHDLLSENQTANHVLVEGG